MLKHCEYTEAYVMQIEIPFNTRHLTNMYTRRYETRERGNVQGRLLSGVDKCEHRLYLCRR